MKKCPRCQSNRIKQTSLNSTRLLLTLYIFLSFYFFTGSIDIGAFIALIPLLVPYENLCTGCNKVIYSYIPKYGRKYIIKTPNTLNAYLLALLPSILTITLLIIRFPNTGLGRIIYLPWVFLINSITIIVFLVKFQKLYGNLKYLYMVFIIIITILVSVLLYPQESGENVIKLIFSQN